MRKVMTVLVAGLALAGCDDKGHDKNNGAPAVKINIPVDGKHSASIGNQLPANLPAYAQIYPGAELLGVTTMEAMPNAPFGGVIQYHVTASPDAIAAFYKKNAEGAGLSTTSGAAIGPLVHYAANKSGEDKAFIAVDIATQPDGKTFVQERYK